MARYIDRKTRYKPNCADDEGSGGGPGGPIGYNRPPITQQVSYVLYDEGWHYINGTDIYVVPPNAVMAKIDPDDPYKLVENNKWGRKFRFTNEQGDYYNSDDGNYYLENGTLDTTAIFNSPHYPTDHYTGLGLWRVRTGSMAYVTLLAFVAAASVGGESDWWLGFRKQIQSVFDLSLIRPLYGSLITDSPVFDIEMTQTSATAYANDTLTRHWGVSPDGSIIARTNTLTDAGHYIRYALP